MVIPFLSLYLTQELGFSLPEVGWIMTAYGLGSILGTWLGGKITDQIGYYPVIMVSLFLGGIGFIGVQYVSSYWEFCIAVFVLMFLIDAHRPAVFIAAENYSKPKNLTRSIALIRLAINLGFSIGPMLGGIIIARISYSALFWIDGLTCVGAVIALYFALKPKKRSLESKPELAVKHGPPPLKNKIYMLFFGIMVISSITFVQYFSLVPLYYSEAYNLTEDVIGWLLFLNGAIIVVAEMPLVGWLERIKIPQATAMAWGMVFLAFSFLIFNLAHGFYILIIGMLFMTIGEMIASPFSNALALKIAPKGRKGSYMGLFSMSFSISHVVGHNAGMNMANTLGYNNTWLIFGILLIGIAFACFYLNRVWKKSPTFIP